MATRSSPEVRVVASIVGLLGALSLNPRDAAARVPDPRMSFVPQCLPICPAGDRSFSILVRDVGSYPVVGAVVELHVIDFNCPNTTVALCEDCPEASNYDPAAHTIRRVTDVNGIAAFTLCGSIFCQNRHWVEVTADGIALSVVRFVTTDLDGDLDVDAQDVTLSTDAEGHEQPQADQTCTNDVDMDDTDIVEAHVGHVCPGVVPAAPSSWGAVKSIYR